MVDAVLTDANGKSLYRAQGRTLGRVVAAQYVAMMNMMMTETLLTGTAHKARISKAGRRPARPAPARISAMPGSSATHRIS